MRLRDLLSHLLVLVPVLDDEKHYWIGDDEVAKLLRRSEGWLDRHPECELIVRRYLRHLRDLTCSALEQLADEDNSDPDGDEAQCSAEEARLEASIGLQQQRLEAVLAALHDGGASRVLDLGCGEGALLHLLLRDRRFTDIVGMEASRRNINIAATRLRLDEMPSQRQRIKLIHGSLLYRDKRLVGYDAAVLVEVIEHIEPVRLGVFERVLFAYTRPGTVILTTPNREYNVKWPGLPPGGLRHRDHRFEWTRAEFQQWARCVAEHHGYTVGFMAVGPEDPNVGSPTQMPGA
jgi:3' terminal RNA ribose 2'-O-methyltransferase Hen1